MKMFLFLIFYFLPSLKLTIFLMLYTKYDAIDIADSSSIQDVLCMNFVRTLLTIEFLWLSGRASEHGI